MALKTASSCSTANAANTRRYELDWLRALVVLGLVPYHAAVVFAVGPGDYVKNATSSLLFDLGATVLAFFGMPLLFLVSGAASWFALGRRSPGRYVLERVGRLAVPFVFGVLVLVPIQLYYGRLATPGYNLNYLRFYQTFLVDWSNILRNGVFGRGLEYWGHLWFVLYLLAVSIFLLPLLMWMRSRMAAKSIGWLASACDNFPGLLALGAPLAIVEAGLRGSIGPIPYADEANLYSGPAGLVLYAVVFVLGYVLFTDARFQAAVVRYRMPALTVAVVLLAVHEAVLAEFGSAVVSSTAGAFAIRCLRGYITWTALVAILGIATHYWRANSGALRYLTESTFPVYVLHMPVLTVLGYYIVRWDIPIFAKFLLLVIGTACGTFGVYELLVRRLPLMRFVFGMKAATTTGAAAGLQRR